MRNSSISRVTEQGLEEQGHVNLKNAGVTHITVGGR